MSASLTCSNRLGCTIASSFVIFNVLVSCPRIQFAIQEAERGLPPADSGPSQRLLTGDIRERLSGRQAALCMSRREFLIHTTRRAQGRDDIFRISRDPVLMKIEAVKLSFLGDPQQSSGIDRI